RSCTGRRARKLSKSRASAGDHAVSASAAMRGKTACCTRSKVRMCSVQTLACTPRMCPRWAGASTAGTGSNSYTSRSVTCTGRPGARGGDAALDAAPGHHGRVRRDPAVEDLVPAQQPAALARQVGLDALDEPALQRGLVGDAELLHPRLHLRRGLPLVLDRLV